ncbi:beta-glucosidase [Arachidicoccus rhizosphaerae]|uniref:Periplasmic beta-glucosidase n=1 Tax=Arachidicoccus rhizosphaerae TaxID=551991 RepID=A0A1H3Z607_9BACT|nr:beta-glucosidase BglX [Arachidicoccus rhizosphaerae]SEA19105.1 beta-glucosidase [Arachidicoccus rhizosphaerae]
MIIPQKPFTPTLRFCTRKRLLRKAVPVFIVATLLASLGTGAAQAQQNSTHSTSLTAGQADKKAFIDQLMAKMTLEEKLGQLNLPSAGDFTTGEAKSSNIAASIREGKVGGLFNIKGEAKIKAVQDIAVKESRLHIPMIFGMDVIHGYETVFPIPLALSTSWDTALIKKTAQAAAREASADGINWTFSPMVDISRDPRWGRVSEGNGEDPFLGSQIAKAMVAGYQGNLSSNQNILACVKHFALYGAIEAGREYNTVDMSHLQMYNDYFPPYKAAVDAGAASVMASFNLVDGIPASGNRWLLTDVLRNQWGFKGFVVSDYTGVPEMTAHGIGDYQQVSALALRAGLDMDMVGEGFLKTLATSLDESKITQAEIDQACRRILEAKYDLGLFKDPYKYCDADRAKTEVFTDSNKAFAKKAATASMVLLKNERQILPLKKTQKIALIGPLADAANQMSGTWAVAANNNGVESLLQAMKLAVADSSQLYYAPGSDLTADSTLQNNVTLFGKTMPRYTNRKTPEQLIQEALLAADKADIIVAALGESAEFSGEASSRSRIGIPDAQRLLLKALVKTGKPVVLVLFNGRPLTLGWEAKNVTAILDSWFGGTMAAPAITDLLFGKANPSAKLTMTFPQDVGQIPLYYNHMNTGRPLPKGKWFEKFKSNYLDVSNLPVYPFGYGLSYTQFKYGKMKLSDTTLTGSQHLTVTVAVTNSGDYDGQEIVQLYIRDLVGSVVRPVQQLKGFQKLSIKKGQTVNVQFTLTPEDLKFYNSELNFDWEAGDFDIMVGTNSEKVQSATVHWSK